MTDLGGKTCIFSHPVYLFLREFSLQDSRGGSLDNESKVKQLLQIRMDELAKLVGQSSVQKSVLSAYGDQGGFVLAPQDNLS
ncbi:flagellar protein FliT domain protein [Escherichia coli 97.0246]|uniref:Flagellar protein FliT domain protein n=1 Tax=Escherichia coli 97.0246 TaxID=869670 RepID=A0A8E0KUF3_ECOLX|nr:flagellar protein FliT domain protein [Escherichia coli 97.0246]